MKPSLTLPLKKLRLVHYLIVIGVLAVLVTVFLIYRQTSRRELVESPFTLLPEDPICIVAAKNLTDAVDAFRRSEFGQRTAQMPILTEIRRQRWWRQFLYQKELWQHEMGGTLNFNKLKGYFGEEAILALYRREDEISFLLISVVGAKEKLEIAAVTAADPLNPSFKRLQNDYEGFTINTITGYPRDFSYAFIGNIGMLTLHQSLIRDAIDIYANQRKGLSYLHPMHESLQDRFDSNDSMIFIDFPRLSDAFDSIGQLVPFAKGIETWTLSNSYQNGTIRSLHRIQWQPKQERRIPAPETIDPKLLSILPGKCAVSYIDQSINPSQFWNLIKANLSIRHQLREPDLTRHLGGGVAVAQIDRASNSAFQMPSIVVAIPLTNRTGLEADLEKLRDHEVVINGKQLQFSEPRGYRDVVFQQVQLPLGLLFSVKGAYALVDDYWIISTTVPGLKSVIDTSTGEGTALAQIQFPEAVNHPRDCHLLIQPNLLFSELSRLRPIISLMGPMMGNRFDFRLMQQVIANLSPIETLGPISAEIDFDSEGMNVEVQVVVPLGDES